MMGGDIRTRPFTATSTTPPASDTGALGSDVVQISNFACYNHVAGPSLGTILQDGTNISTSSYVFTAQAQTILGATTVDTGTLTSTTAINHAQLCSDGSSGAFCSTDSRTDVNNQWGVFSSLTPTPDDPSNDVAFSFADQQCGQAVFGNLGMTTGMLMNVCAATLTHTGGAFDTGGSFTYNTLVTEFSFISDTGGIVDVAFNASEYLEAWAAGDTSVNALMSCEITIDDITGTPTVVFDWMPDGTGARLLNSGIWGAVILDPITLNGGKSFTAPTAGADFIGASLGVKNTGAAYKANTPVLIAGHTYRLTVNVTLTNTN